MVRMLPIVLYRGKKYFLDERLRQVRNVLNPHDFIDFLDLDYAPEELVRFVPTPEQ